MVLAVAIDLDALRTWLGVPATVVDDEALTQVVNAEASIQASLCSIPPDDQLPAELVQAIYRRVGREVAAKGVPLGIVGVDAEFGPAQLRSWDAEIDRLEGPRRRFVFG